MRPRRGDVVLARFPFSSGADFRIRPALVVQCDANDGRLKNVIVAAITTTVHRSGEPTQLLIELATPLGQQSSVLQDSVVTCVNLATIEQRLIRRNVGSLPVDPMATINRCLQTSLGIH